LEFGNPGLKNRKDAEEKLARKGYQSTKQLTDVVRAGFRAETPDAVQRAINMLALRFRVLDEGWNLSKESYFDRKVLVQFKDGTIGEVQFWEPSLIDAKTKTGHALYKKARALPMGHPDIPSLIAQQQELYEEVISGLSSDWLSAIGRSGSSGNVIENASRSASSPSSGRPESTTSAKLTSDQSAPGSSTAQARGPSETAGRNSQSKKSMDPLLDEGGEWRKAMVKATLDDGSTVDVKAGDVVDFIEQRRKGLAQLLECLNAA
jgi:hypothetical protein